MLKFCSIQTRSCSANFNIASTGVVADFFSGFFPNKCIESWATTACRSVDSEIRTVTFKLSKLQKLELLPDDAPETLARGRYCGLLRSCGHLMIPGGAASYVICQPAPAAPRPRAAGTRAVTVRVLGRAAARCRRLRVTIHLSRWPGGGLGWTRTLLSESDSGPGPGRPSRGRGRLRKPDRRGSAWPYSDVAGSLTR